MAVESGDGDREPAGTAKPHSQLGPEAAGAWHCWSMPGSWQSGPREIRAARGV